jgi:hypothetical protein
MRKTASLLFHSVRATFREWLKALKRRNRLVATFGLKCAGKEKPPEGGFESLA